jgi:hypothetical protein
MVYSYNVYETKQVGSITIIASVGFWQGKIYGSRPWDFAKFEVFKE